MKHFYTGCTHFYHDNILRYCDRPFESVEEMNSVMLDNFNSAGIKRSDCLWMLGDVCFGNAEKLWKILNKMPTRNIKLIRGNHDHFSVTKYKAAGFTEVYSYHEHRIELPTINDEVYSTRKKRMVLFHYPIHRWHGGSSGKSWHLHCHTHLSLPNDPTVFRMNVGVDMNNFAPLSQDDIAEYFHSIKDTADPQPA